ncbi:phage head closure protein [Holzapfeliella sp. JNUCC 72]
MRQLVDNINEMNEIITILDTEMTTNDYGVPIYEDTEVGWTFAKVLTQRTEVATVSQTDTTTFVIRYDQKIPIETGTRIKWGGSEYTVLKRLRDTAYKEYDSIICEDLRHSKRSESSKRK